MLKIIFYLKTGKVNKKGESPIFARITYNQKSTTMATGGKSGQIDHTFSV